jgi:hypothetical protein
VTEYDSGHLTELDGDQRTAIEEAVKQAAWQPFEVSKRCDGVELVRAGCDCGERWLLVLVL